jgi:hypothetical protein
VRAVVDVAPQSADECAVLWTVCGVMCGVPERGVFVQEHVNVWCGEEHVNVRCGESAVVSGGEWGTAHLPGGLELEGRGARPAKLQLRTTAAASGPGVAMPISSAKASFNFFSGGN